MDPELIRRAQRGDHRAFEALAVFLHPRFFRLAHGVLREPELAEEATQQAFIDAWRFLRRLRDPARFVGWSHGLLVGSCRKGLKRQSGQEAADKGAVDAPPSTPDPFRIAIDRHQLARGFARLPVDDRAALVMRYLLDLPVADTAAALAQPEEKVAPRVSHVLQALDAELEADARSASDAPGSESRPLDEQRLATGLSGWLHDTEAAPPDTRMSASRVMAGIEWVPQLGRWWPPARLAPKVEPMPALGAPLPEGGAARPVRRPPGPTLTNRVRSVITPVRALSVAVIFALVLGTVLIVASLLPGGDDRLAAAPAAALPSAVPSAVPPPRPTSTPGPTPTPVPTWAPSDQAMDWRGGGVRMEADALKLRVNEELFIAPGAVLSTGATYADHARLETHWYEHDVEQRMVLELELDDTHWWIDEIKAYDGAKRGDWVEFGDLASVTRTPLGEVFEADLQLQSTGAGRKALRADGAAKLRIDGLRLTALGPGMRPAPLTGCDHIDDPRITAEGWSGSPLQEVGEPLENLTGMTPAEVEAVLVELGLCYRFDHSWPGPWQLEDERLKEHAGVVSDRRCSAPASGRLEGLSFGPDAPADTDDPIVFVQVVEGEERDWPEPPPAGTDCPFQ